MTKVKKFIRKTNILTRVLSVLLVIAILGGSFVWFGDSDMENVSAEGAEKKYAEYIIDRVTGGVQSKFNILEIVPYEGFGEFRYFLNRQEVITGLEEKLNSSNIGWCTEDQREWKKLEGSGFGKFGYQVRYDYINERYEVKGDDSFLYKMFGEQAGILANRINLNTVEANNLTENMIKEADLIVFSSSPHDDATLKLYEAWSGNTGYKFYKQDQSGEEAADDTYYYDTYEKVNNVYVSRDMKWECFKELIECTVIGRELQLSNLTNVTLKTPVIMDISEISGLENASFVYKFSLIYRTLCGADNIDNTALNNACNSVLSWMEANKSMELSVEILTAHLSSISYNKYIDNCFKDTYNTWLTDYFLCYDGRSLLTRYVPWSSSSDRFLYFKNKNTNNWDVVKGYFWILGSTDHHPWPGNEATKLADGTYKVKVEKDATMVIFNNAPYAGASGLEQTADLTIPTDGKNYYDYETGSWGYYTESVGTTEGDFSSGTGVTTRTGSSAKLPDVLQFLMGSKPGQLSATYDYGHTTIKLEERTTPNITEDYSDWMFYYCTNGTPHAYMWNGTNNNGWDTAPSMKDFGDNIYGIKAPSAYVNVAFWDDQGQTDDLNIQKGKIYKDNVWSSYTPVIKTENVSNWSINSVKVLEVQPYNSYTYKGLEGANKLGKKLLMQGAGTWDENGGNNDYRHFIQVTGVTTNALNGMTDDLRSEYDIIIIGEDITPIVKENGKPIYNDRALNGYVYLAFGDLFKIHTNALGILPDDYIAVTDTSLVKLDANNKRHFTEYLYNSLKVDKYYALKNMQLYYENKDFGNTGKFYSEHELGNIRGVDNDITDITRQKLIKFAESGKTIILSDKLYNLDVYSVYPTSDMYELCEELSSYDTDGNRKYEVYSFEYMSGAVNNKVTGNPVITMIKQPTPPAYTGDVISTFNETGKDINYKFRFIGKTNTNYRIKLYVDKNSDGVYKGIEEGVSDDTNELYFSRDVNFQPNNADGTMTYEINSRLSDNFVGMLSWKIEVVELDSSGDETSYSNSVKGYSAIKNTVKQTIKVLQITSVDRRDGKNGSDDFKGDDVTLDMGKNYDDKDDDFKDLLLAIEDEVGYAVDITVLNSDEYADLFNSAPYNNGQNDHLKDYHMVVIGFADMFSASNVGDAQITSDISNKNGAVDNIVAFIDAGKAVLFTHDTITWRVAPNNKTNNKTNSNGTTDSKKLWESKNLDEYGNTHDNKMPYHDNACHNLTVALRDRVGLDKYGSSLLPTNRVGYEKPEYAPNVSVPTYTDVVDGKYYVQEIQGYTPWFYYRNNFCLTYHSSYSSGADGNNDDKKGLYSLRPFDNSVVSTDRFGFSRDGIWSTKKVSQVNEGCVTQYPYLISENIDIAETHGQYFSLNMEDEDVVVWYTLAGDGGNMSQYYSATDKDAENNYYIYSKNNITYSGAGHRKINDDSSVEERKLFVNTVIKAIAGGNSAPAITVTNGAVGAGDIHVVYVSEGNASSDYEMHILARDADLVSPEAAGINYLLREADLDSLTEEQVDVIGRFEYAKIYWKKSDGTLKEIAYYNGEYTGNNKKQWPLRNGVIKELRLGDTSLTSTELQTIEHLVEGDDTSTPDGAYFVIEVSDWLGAVTKINVKLVKRDLFLID